MDHRFNVEIAVRYGIPEALIIGHLHYWIRQLRLSNKTDHYIAGRWWTYTTVKDIATVFPYFNEVFLYRVIARLVKSGAVIVGRFNRSNINQTRWYALSDEILALLDGEFANLQNGDSSNLQICKMEFANLQNGTCKSANSHITNNNNTNNNNTNISSNARAHGTQPGPGNSGGTAETTSAFRDFESRFGSLGPKIVERIATLLREYGDDIYARAWEKLKGATPAVTNPNRGIKYLEVTCLGLAAGQDYGTRKKKNDVAAAAMAVEQALLKETGDENISDTSDSVWGVWKG